MELIVDEISDGVTRAVLVGRMDLDGAASIDERFSALAAAAAALVVDLSEVTFMASMGIRTLMLCARDMAARGRRMALVNPQANVEKALRWTGADEVMAISRNLNAAAQALKA
jgi:anti-anti-sigma factor